jgi:glycosyl transferase family 6
VNYWRWKKKQNLISHALYVRVCSVNELTIAIVLVATGRSYRQFLNPLIPQIERLFTKYPKHIFLVSDVAEYPGAQEVLHVEHLPVPLPSLLRYHWICRLRTRLLQYDYVYYLDVDTEILQLIGEQVLRPLIAVKHWAWSSPETRIFPTFEARTESSAYVDPQKAVAYFHGSFQGGQAQPFLQTARVLRDWINEDLTNRGKGHGGMIAVWYDESYWNRFVNENLDCFSILGPEYACNPGTSTKSSRVFIRLRRKDERRLWSWIEE